jgi:serine protease Do
MPNLEEIPEPFRRFFGNQPNAPRMPMRAEGSGFVIDSDGYIVTNNHVVDAGEKITVTLSNGDQLPATLVGRDPGTDLALLKVEPEKPLSYVPFAESDNLRVGDWVVAVGNPFGLGGTVTAGIVSARGREIASGRYNDFIQIDAPINQGNSGGPTFDLQGRVVGVNTLIFSPSGGNVGIGFAIPAATAREIVKELKSVGEISRGYLGVNIQPISEEIAESMDLSSTMGALVTQVRDDSPAKKAGLRAGDVVTEVNGDKIDDVRHMTRLVGALKPDETAKFKLIRGGKTKNLKVKIEKLKEVAELPQDEDESSSTAELGMALAPLDDDMRSRAGVSSTTQGAVITSVAPYSEAAQKGIRPGDVIIEVNQIPVSSPADVEAQIAEAIAAGEDSVLLFVQTREINRFVALGLVKDE